MQPIGDLVPLLSSLGYKPAARLRPRTAREIGTSPWSIGCETIDRGYVDFDQTGVHLGELGATQARLQAGWARCEPIKGQDYQWQWLDRVIDGCISQGVKPWLQTSYGNPAYSGGGGIGLSEGIPTSPEALAAWDRWVSTMVDRYIDRVTTWEIWNESSNQHNGKPAVEPEAFADFHARTARIIRAKQPNARIVGLVIGHNDGPYPRRFFRRLAEIGAGNLIDDVCFHFYPHNPDHAFGGAEDLARLARRYAPGAVLRQGETGAPSDCNRFMAMGNFDWSERKQAAWDVRRLLAHHARGIAMNLFQLADMYYAKRDGALFAGYNSKGLLRIRPDLTVAYRKPAYFAAQHLFSVFDNRFPLRELPQLDTRSGGLTAAHCWTIDDSPALIGWWDAANPPALTTPALGNVGLKPLKFRQPVLVDFLSGVVFDVPAEIAAADDLAWSILPCADVPLALAERSILPLRELET